MAKRRAIFLLLIWVGFLTSLAQTVKMRTQHEFTSKAAQIYVSVSSNWKETANSKSYNLNTSSRRIKSKRRVKSCVSLSQFDASQIKIEKFCASYQSTSALSALHPSLKTNTATTSRRLTSLYRLALHFRILACELCPLALHSTTQKRHSDKSASTMAH